MRPAWVARLALTDFRSYAAATIEAGPGAVVLTGPNGAGKTNVLEAVSMLAPGRGLRGAALAAMARDGGAGGWAVAARLGGGDAADLGTGATASAPDRRQARVNGAGAPVGAFAERLALIWLTPAMDRLLAEGASARRRFLDRLVLALDPGHGRHAIRYEAAMRDRTRVLTGERAGDPRWLTALEAAMGEHGAALDMARARLIEALAPLLAATAPPFPAARLALGGGGFTADALAGELARRRAADAAAGRATAGPHRADLLVTDAEGQSAERCSTGEQKALLIGIVLAHAALVAERRGRRPVLLLDEVAAHLDPARRHALFERLAGAGQVWMTGTDAALFDGLGGAATRIALPPAARR